MQRATASRTWVAVLSAMTLWGCAAVAPGPLCVPGSTDDCTCTNGASGAQHCNAEGSGYESCLCEVADVASAGDTVQPEPDVAVVPDVTGAGLDTAQPDMSADDPDALWTSPDVAVGPEASDVSADGSDGQDVGEEEPDEPEGPGVIVSEPDDEAAVIFEQDELRTYAITIDPADLAFLDADPAAEEYVAATLEFEGESYPVGMRYKGSVGAFMAPCTSNAGPAKTGKCSTKLSFTWNNPGARFFGMKRLNFHSMQRDRALMRDRLGYAMFREFGGAASRAVHVRLMINGELEGLFVLVEQVDGRFTRARFTEGGKGNLYKEIWPMHDDAQAYIDALETNEDDNPSVAGMLLFKESIEYSTWGMESWLDRQMMINFIAADRVMINDDGVFHWWCSAGGQGNNPPPNGNHNYFWYQAAHAPRFWLIPWDLDNIFNSGQNSSVHVATEWSKLGSCSCNFSSQRAASCDTMIARWGTDWLADYELAVDAFIAGPFAATNVNAKLEAWESQISAVVTETSGLNGAVTFSEWQTHLSYLRETIDNARLHGGYDY